MNILNTLRKPYLSFFLSFLILFTSCSKNETVDEISSISKNILQKRVEDKALIDSFIELQETKLQAKGSLNIQFDNNNVYEVSIDENSQSMIMANQIGFNESNNENYAISAAITENGLANPLIVKTSKTSSSIYKIEYFNRNMELISTIELDSESETINSFNNYKNRTSMKSSGCGQAVADCMDDVYSNHGWVSVWALVQTAFIPATAAALAGACAVSECL